MTSAAGATTGQLTISACDPGDTVASSDGRVRLSLGGAPLRAEQFHQLQVTHPQISEQQLACSVYGSDSVSQADERSLIDPVGGWIAPTAHPAPDPNRAGCAPA